MLLSYKILRLFIRINTKISLYSCQSPFQVLFFYYFTRVLRHKGMDILIFNLLNLANSQKCSIIKKKEDLLWV